MLPVTRKSIARRTFLRGTGAALALPLLDAMTPAFATATARPIRLGFIEVPNGIMKMDKFTPATEGTDFALTPVLEPLAEFRDRMSVLSGLDQGQAKGLSFEVGGDHPRTCTAWLTGTHCKDDLRRRLAGRNLRRSGRGKGIRQIHPARLARGRPGIRPRWWGPASSPMAAPITTRSRGATRPRHCRWRTARALCSSVFSAIGRDRREDACGSS